MRVSLLELWRPAILQPVDPGKVILPLWKALSSRNWNLIWKLEYLGSERPQTKFSEGGAFLVNWAVAPPGWCHTQFLYEFWKLCVRAFKWYLICGISPTGRFFKWTRQKTLDLGVWFHSNTTVFLTKLISITNLCISIQIYPFLFISIHFYLFLST